MKPCNQCGSIERYKDGRCAPCTRAKNQRWKSRNKTAHKAGSARWATAHPEAVKSAKARWRAANPEAARASSARWQNQNPEAHQRAAREWGRRNRAAVTTNTRQWRTRYPERHVASEHARRVRKLGSGGNYTADEWRALCAFFSYRCLRCGTAQRPQTTDHIIPVSLDGPNSISNIQPLCQPCNSAKGTACTDYRLRWILAMLILASWRQLAAA